MDICMNEIVIHEENIEHHSKPDASDIDIKDDDMTHSSENNIAKNYETDDSDATIPMECSDIEFIESFNLFRNNIECIEQFKDLTNAVTLRPRRSKINDTRIIIDTLKSKAPKKVNKPKVNDCQIVTIPEEFYEGKLMWCKLPTYPWWPCMIYHSPENVFYKTNSIHVVYLGPKVERGWILIKNSFPYEGKEKYDLIVNKLISENAPKKVLNNYGTNQNILWKKAWKEAESAMLLNLQQRIKHHGIRYKNSNGDSSDSDFDSDSDSTEAVNSPIKAVKVLSPAAVNEVVDSEELKSISDIPNVETENQINADKNQPIEVTIDCLPSAVLKEVPLIEEEEKEEGEKEEGDKEEGEKEERIKEEVNKIEDIPECAPLNVDTEMDDIILVFSRSPIKRSRRGGIKTIKKAKRPKAISKAIVPIKIEKSSEPPPMIVAAKKEKKLQTETKADESKKGLICEYLNLKAPIFGNSKKSPLCHLCFQESSDVAGCAGSCGQSFHRSCMCLLLDHLTDSEEERIFRDSLNDRKCIDCNKNQRRCFICSLVIVTPSDIVKCSYGNCLRHYHSDCLKNDFYQSQSHRKGQPVCPAHTCRSCHLDDPGTVRHASGHLQCLLCPAAYHRGDWCIPAGSRRLAASWIVCPQHLAAAGASDSWRAPLIGCVDDEGTVVGLKGARFGGEDHWRVVVAKKVKRFANVSWCFLCSGNGDLVCCESCPASYHIACLDNVSGTVFDRFVCEECRHGRWPRYSEICWLKIGNYRWWPAQIVMEENAPDNVRRARHRDGQFLVLFFGTNDYHWCNRTIAFSFDDGDDTASNIAEIGSGASVSRKTMLDGAYRLSLGLAGQVHRLREARWLQIVGNKPRHYRTIKNNIPVGNVRMNKLDVANQCECRPGVGKNDNDPCGITSDCINVTLMYECDPQHCRNATKCRNQRFSRRIYPKQEVFYTPDRGWALRIKESVEKGTFINEYVGEVIDEEEADRRLKKAHENNITNFYMMELEGGRIIDAGPAANISRFMNHSCSPNVFTQKWIVNGDTRVGVFALKHIDADEELTFNYHFLSLGQIKIPCKCGASNCSGFLGEPPKADPHALDQGTTNKRTKKRPLATQSTTDNKTERQTLNKKRKLSPSNKSLPLSKNHKELSDTACFVCKGRQRCNLVCSYDYCPRIYHSNCVAMGDSPGDNWFCPWHFCDDCGRVSSSLCAFCTVSFCESHLGDRIVPHGLDNTLACRNHHNRHTPTDTRSSSHTGTESPPSVSI